MSKDRYYRNMLLILMGRFIENEYGEGALKALLEWKHKKIRKQFREISKTSGRSDPEYLFRLFSDEVHKFEVIRKDRKALEVKVTWCAHADTFRKFNAMDLGKMLICEGDHAVVEGFNPKIKFTRPQCLMDGDDCCHFKFELQEE